MKIFKMPTFVKELSNYLIGIKNLSEVYVESMMFTLEQFLEYLNIHDLNNKYDSIEKFTMNDMRAVTNSQIYNFIYFLVELHYSMDSRIVKIEHLRTLFKYLFKIKDSLFIEPFKQIKREKNCMHKLPNYLSIEESKRLLNVYANSEKITEIRNNAMLHIFLNCGLRLSEMKNLNINDINLQNNTFVILGKGNKERTGYLNTPTKQALQKYLDIRYKFQEFLDIKDNALFLNIYGSRLSIKSIKEFVKEAYSKANIDKHTYSTHSLRHTCATLLYRNGTDLKVIQTLLGHVKIDTTEIYTHLYDKDVMNAMLEHPLSRFNLRDALALCA